MAHVISDRVKETTLTTGTGALALAGAATGYRAFNAACSAADTVYYAIEAVDSNGRPTGDWEVGLGTYSSADTLTRTTPQASSNAGAAVNFAAGTKNVWLDVSAAQIAGVNAGTLTATTGFIGPLITLGASGILVGGANLIEQRNGVNSQTLRVYETFTDTSNYRYTEISTASGTTTIAARSLGTGGGAMNIVFTAIGGTIGLGSGGGGAARWTLGTAGHLTANADNTYDIGASAATRPRSVFVGTSVVSPTYRTGGINTQTGATYAIAVTDTYVIANIAGTQTLTMPAAASFTGRRLVVKTITANTVVSAASDVVPLVGGAAGTAILAATAGKYAELVSDGTSWVIMQAN